MVVVGAVVVAVAVAVVVGVADVGNRLLLLMGVGLVVTAACIHLADYCYDRQSTNSYK